MILQKNTHTFHIPVMGLAFTIDSPIRVAQYGIDSVISIMDDDLIEKMTAFYAQKFKQPYEEISQKVEDFRAKRITNYLNLIDTVVTQKFESFKAELIETRSKLDDFMTTLPSSSQLKKRLEELIASGKDNFHELQTTLNHYFHPGSIDVNIMTKLDKDNFKDHEQLPVIYNDAHSALRGFMNSTTNSSVVFSAGMNPRLFSYMESFDAFYPNENGQFQKKIILKVSDFRSAMIQGNFLAKKGLWVSEYRIESGLNCGGHAFATDGFLLGPILEEFKNKKQDLIQSAYGLLTSALTAKNKTLPKTQPDLKLTVQGGVGTAEEHQFLLDHYNMDAVGWGSPFLLVPEATSVDVQTRKLLAGAKPEDLYLSNISPLGVPFNTIKGTTNDFYKNQRIASGKAGSSCPKKFLALSKEYDPEGSCSASKKYQDKKIEALEETRNSISEQAYTKAYTSITEKSCLCVGLANPSLLEFGIPVKGQNQGVVVCPGPNMAYFSKEVSLKEMMHHIYGTKNIENHENRPNMFVKELELYVTYLTNQINDTLEITAQQIKKWETFKTNLTNGISYYKALFTDASTFPSFAKITADMAIFENKLQQITYQEPAF
jgi:BMFP domain-containing protein YqiC